jgi:hypothetical protein
MSETFLILRGIKRDKGKRHPITGHQGPRGQDFLYTFILALGPTQPPVQWVPGLSRG